MTSGTPGMSSWLPWTLLSVVFGALMAIFAKASSSGLTRASHAHFAPSSSCSRLADRPTLQASERAHRGARELTRRA